MFIQRMYFYVYCMFVNTISNNISRSSREFSALDSHQEFIFFFHRDFIFRLNTRPMDWKEVWVFIVTIIFFVKNMLKWYVWNGETKRCVKQEKGIKCQRLKSKD